MTDTMSEGVLVKWTVKKGDEVKSGDILAEVETDKATMDLENFEKGTILELLVEEGLSLPVNSPIAIIGKVGEDISALITQAKSGSAASASTPSEITEKEVEVSTSSSATPSPVINNAATAPNTENGRIKISPLAKKLAGDKGIDIQSVNGSGEGGRIIKKDIENYSPAAKAIGNQTASATFGVESFSEVPVSQMRKTIANRLAESKFSAPHFYLTMEIEMNRLLEARERINASGEHKISVNDMIVKASAMALVQNPAVNSSWLGDKIRYNNHVHIGVAVAVDEGLLVPVVRFANHKSLSNISAEVKDFGKKARDKKLQPSDWQGNTFTISNLGMFGIEEFTAIINPPDACILAVGSVKDVLALNDGDIEVKKVMKVTLSCDHRVVDGVVGSKFLQTLKSYLEDPIKMLL